jgi:hypothetical protein
MKLTTALLNRLEESQHVYLTPEQRLMKERKAFVRREAARYLKNTDMTSDERKEVLNWVSAGESVRENPWLMTDDDGYPLDYLAAKRTFEELREQHFG